MARRFAYLVAAVLVAVAGLLAAALAALAHAELVSTSPADGAVLARAPARVSLTFDERVDQIAHGIRVYSPAGDRVDSGPTRYGSRAPEITAALLPHLARGTYTVAWHVARLRWSVTGEAGIAVAVLAVTAALVNTPTARETFHPRTGRPWRSTPGGPAVAVSPTSP